MIDVEKVKELYGECKVYGPYTSKKDGRKRCVLTFDKCSRKQTISYPKLLMEINLGRKLSDDETVDHIDDDHTNNDCNNLQVLTRVENAKKAHETGASSVQHLIDYSRSDQGREASSVRMQQYNKSRTKRL